MARCSKNEIALDWPQNWILGRGPAPLFPRVGFHPRRSPSVRGQLRPEERGRRGEREMNLAWLSGW
jgi:hypothetical protein